MTLGVLSNGVNAILGIMKTSPYTIIPVHQRPDLFMDCCRLINSEWPSSDTRRLRTLGMSCDEFPTCLVLLNNDNVIGHCKVSLVPSMEDSCFIESVVIDYGCRSQGLGSKLLRGVEDYIVKKGKKNIYLATKGQEEFYFKNGYGICEPIDMWRAWTPTNSNTNSLKSFNHTNNTTSNSKLCGPRPPRPPPLPLSIPKNSKIKTSKTYMVKKL